MVAGNWGNSSTWTICLILWGIKLNMYKILLVDDEIQVRDAIRENIDWKGLDCFFIGCKYSNTNSNCKLEIAKYYFFFY